LPARYRNPILAIVALGGVALTVLNHLSTPDATASPPPRVLIAHTAQPGAATTVADREPLTASGVADAERLADRFGSIEKLAARDPWAVARLGQERYDRDIREYTCVFVKRERIDGKLRDVEEIEVRYRDEPKTVFMIWKRNAQQAKRVLFKDTPEYVNDKGEKVAHVEPAGALIRLIVSDVLMPIHGKRAHQSSRRFIDQFGFRSTLDLLDRYNQLGADCGALEYSYDGAGEIDGRPTYRFIRYLPYNGPDGIWPDAKMVMHLDQEWLLPTAVFSYADREGAVLLGSYVHTKIRLNPGLDDAAFEF